MNPDLPSNAIGYLPQGNGFGIETAITALAETIKGQNSNSFTDDIGIIAGYGGYIPPTGWLICNGAAISRVGFASLFAKIGTGFGIGDGSTTFNLPNLQGKVPVGYDATQTEFDLIGETGGHKLLQAHVHAGATRSVYVTGGGAQVADPNGTGSGYNVGTTGGGNAQNLQPYQVISYIIRYAQNVTPVSASMIKNPYMFRAYRSAAYNTVSATSTLLPLDAKTYDLNANFNVGTGLYTAPISGYYRVSGSVGYDHDGFINISIYKNGALYSTGGQDFYDTGQASRETIADTVYLGVNDTLGLVYYCDGVKAMSVGSSAAYLAGELVSVV